MEHVFLCAFLFISGFSASYAADCCGSYTDASGTYHDAELCEDYCCIKIDLDLFTHGAYKECCSDASRQIPATQNENEDCVKDWVDDNTWLLISGGALAVVLIIICFCCCCRRRSNPVVIHYPGQSTTVTVANSSVINQNPVHSGYDQ